MSDDPDTLVRALAIKILARMKPKTWRVVQSSSSRPSNGN